MKLFGLSLFLAASLAGAAMAQAPGLPTGSNYTQREFTDPNFANKLNGADAAGKSIRPSANPLQQKEAGELAAEAGIACTLTDAGVIMNANRAGVRTVSYEIACKNDFGWIVTKTDKAITAYDCLALLTSARAVKGRGPKLTTCRLAANIGSVAGLDALTQKAGLSCKPSDGIYLGGGGDPAISRYEVACEYGGGYIIDAPQPRSKAKLQTLSCSEAKAAGLSCSLKSGKG
ncbi:hypothetical protein [Caulobacter sp. HMWF025]|uniref:hypothetical protein n=2 Tax=unclassified Caulobacter TaxID=2648921 RepID=UPI000D35A8F3|nr:hypothetical protein [Caulobacter sp. HMWF025]PTT06063.1 hypothetical protein DBR10_14000 [Caulobacter sp. HMWF025]